MPDPKIRYMIANDIPAALEIDGFDCDLPPLTEGDFVAFCRKRKIWRPIVLVDGLCVQAYCVIKLGHRTLYIERFASHPDFGDELALSFFLEDITAAVREGQSDRLVLQVEEHDLDRQLYLQRLGFVATANLRGACDGISDAIQFEFGMDLLRERA